jgi:hypothetical protein
MTQIIDVSPTSSNTNASDRNHSVTGRMLSLACSPDGGTVYAGSYSNIWVSTDNGQNFEQLTWPQPPAGQFDAPGSLGGWCVVDMATGPGWSVDNHIRVLAQLTTKGTQDIVGFGDCGVWTALGNGDGTFANPKVVLNNFGPQAGGWQVNKHPRFVVDLTGDGKGDIVGFGDAGVWTALGNGDGTFQPAKFVIQDFGVQQGWSVDKHPRFLAVLTNSGHPDIVGFGDAGVWTALGNGDGTFQAPKFVLADYGYNQGWRVENNPRLLAALTKSKWADIVGFGTAGVWTALSNGDGTFRQSNTNPVIANFGYNQGWRVTSHPRMTAVLTSSGFQDIVAFGDDGVWTALSKGDGTFTAPTFVLQNFGVHQSWQVNKHPRFVTRLTPGGPSSIVGFGDAGVWTALGGGNGTFHNATFVLQNFGVNEGWQVAKHPRFVSPLGPQARTSIVGFGDAGVWTAVGDGVGGFPTSNFVLASFGCLNTLLAIVAQDRESGKRGRGIWRSPDAGTTWMQVHQFPSNPNVGQLQWPLGGDHLVYAAGGSSLAISKDGGLSFTDAFPWGTGPAKQVNHVAVWLNEAADLQPAVIYALGNSSMYLSFDGGATWMEDHGAIPPNLGGSVSVIANSTTPNVLVISPRFLLEVFITRNGSGGSYSAELWRGDYSSFPFGNHTSTWDAVPIPNMPNQDSGMAFLTATQRGRGDLLFFNGQRFDGGSHPFVWVGPLFPNSASDWKLLDDTVHVDMHGILLSPDFAATLQNGNYHVTSGTIWLLSDGGIYRSTNGGVNFASAKGATTLATVRMAGTSLPGKGPAISLNTGDNDGFYTTNGGANWSYQQYGGGDNDCSFADPLRGQTMMVFTPRWDTAGNSTSGRLGNTVSVYEGSSGQLGDASASSQRKAVTGPPTLPDGVPGRAIWNASSGFGLRGSRPIILSLAGQASPPQGDYVFLLFNPPGSPAPVTVLVRTQNIWDIKHREEWITTATAPGQGKNVFRQAAPLPLADLSILQPSGGHVGPFYYVGGDATNSLWVATQFSTAWTKLVPCPTASAAIRFFVDPYRPNLIYILDTTHVKRSDNGGQTWAVDTSLETQLTWNHLIPIGTNDNTLGLGDGADLILTDMVFHPTDPNLRFAIGEGGAFMTRDGANWTRIYHAGALAGRPTSCFYDWISIPSNPSLYVGLAGRGVIKITSLP